MADYLASRLGLLRRTAAVLSNRSVSEANLPFVSSRLRLVHALGRSLSDRHDGLLWLRPLTSELRLENHKAICHTIVSRMPPPPGPTGGFFKVSWTSQLPLSRYDQIHVIFSTEIGIGDEITFCQLFRCFPQARLHVWSTIAEFWKRLAFSSSEYGGATPELPFEQLTPGSTDSRTLIIHVGFLDCDFIASAYHDFRNCDLIEITLGNHDLRLWTGGRHVTSYRPTVDGANNYEFVHELLRHVFLAESSQLKMSPAFAGGLGHSNVGSERVLVNPLTSKRLILPASDWVDLIGTIVEAIDRERRFEIAVFPGFTPGTHDFARRVCQGLKDKHPRLKVDLLRNSRKHVPTAEEAMDVILDQMETAHMMIGVDTYTAHLAPLYGVPTYTLFYSNATTFRVPGARTVPLSLQNGISGILDSVRAYARLTGKTRDEFAPSARDAIERVVEASLRLLSSFKENDSDRGLPVADLIEIARSKDAIRRALGARDYERLVLVSGRPALFDLAELLESGTAADADVRRIAHHWLTSIVCTVLMHFRGDHGC